MLQHAEHGHNVRLWSGSCPGFQVWVFVFLLFCANFPKKDGSPIALTIAYQERDDAGTMAT